MCCSTCVILNATHCSNLSPKRLKGNSKRSRHCKLFVGCCLEQEKLNTVFFHLGKSHIITVSLLKKTLENCGHNLINLYYTLYIEYAVYRLLHVERNWMYSLLCTGLKNRLEACVKFFIYIYHTSIYRWLCGYSGAGH